MNCNEFSEHAAEIARARMMDAGARARALRHADGCESCAAHLARERTLSAALRATAESMGGAAAPARVETTLLAAFRANRDAAREVGIQPAGPSRAADRAARGGLLAHFGRRARVAAAATAIAASLVAAFVVARRPQQPDSPPTQNQLIARRAAEEPTAAKGSTAAAPASPVPSREQPAADPASGGGVRAPGVVGDAVRRPSRVQRAAGGQSLKKTLTETAHAFEIDGGAAVFAEADGGSQPAPGAGEAASLAGDAGALTDFVPLSAGSGSTPMDGGQVVRVEAPRAALASLGLPVDARRAGETVRADLLIGHDGTARAIRLVR